MKCSEDWYNSPATPMGTGGKLHQRVALHRDVLLRGDANLAHYSGSFVH